MKQTPSEPTPLAPNPVEAARFAIWRLFEEGYRFSRGGPRWQATPPGLDADAQPPPRTGTKFTVVEPETADAAAEKKK